MLQVGYQYCSYLLHKYRPHRHDEWGKFYYQAQGKADQIMIR